MSMQKTTLKIEGMMCGMCEAHLCEAVRNAFPGCKVTASHRKGSMEILSDAVIQEDALAQVIAATGYTLCGCDSVPYEKRKLFSGHRKERS